MFMLAVLLFAASPKPGPQFDAPLSKRTVVVSPSTTAAGNIVRTCWSYDGFTIAETNDPGNKGAVAVVVRGTHAPENDCIAEGKALDVPEGYFWGAIGRFAVTHSADGFGDIEGFTVHDSTTAKTLYDAEGDLSDLAMKPISLP